MLQSNVSYPLYVVSAVLIKVSPRFKFELKGPMINNNRLYFDVVCVSLNFSHFC